MIYLEYSENKAPEHILYKCPAIGTLIRKVKMVVVNRAVLREPLCLFFPLRTLPKQILKLEIIRFWKLKVREQEWRHISPQGKAIWLELNMS